MPHFARGNALRGKHKPRRRRCRERDCSSSSSSNKDDGAQGRARRRDSDPAPPFRSEQRSRRRRSRAASATSQPFESKENGVAPAARSAFSAAANCRLDDDRCFPPGLAVNTVGLELHPLETCIASAATQQLSSSSASVSGASSPSSSPVTSGRSGSGTVIPMLSLDEEKTVSPSQPARQLKHAASCEHLSRGGVPSQLAGLSPRPLSRLVSWLPVYHAGIVVCAGQLPRRPRAQVSLSFLNGFLHVLCVFARVPMQLVCQTHAVTIGPSPARSNLLERLCLHWLL
eukprot:INCI1062.2.p1 GENE.INCI1062.2~~INCI1062.2.p1  ORF type:complete len:286 (-),score=31.70 INCI1062.2:498-1355(-)